MSNPRKLITPPINASGVYVLYEPFAVSLEVVFRCAAIRSFSELISRQINVFKDYYEPHDISFDDYELDLSKGASIVTLISSEGEYVYVPNTYIQSYPGMTGIRYDRKVVVLELGMTPDILDIDYLLPELNDTVKKAVGVDADAKFATVPYTKPVTHDQHVQLEATRRSEIARHVPLVEQNQNLQARNEELEKQVEELTAIIIANEESSS